MKPKLILINGNPGMGKTTLARLYAEQHPLTLNLDVDLIWHMMGQWEERLSQSHQLKLQHAYKLADAHLSEGYDVIVPNLMETTEQHENFERVARAHQAVFREVVLMADKDTAIERCKARARRLGYEDGFRPGGVLDTHGRERRLAEMYENVIAATALRAGTVIIRPTEGDVAGAYRQLIDAVK